MRLAAVALAVPLLALARPAAAQHAQPGAARRVTPCAPPGRGAVFTFGRTGGNLRPAAISIDAAGLVSRAGAETAASGARVAADTVASLARAARDGGFWALAVPAPRAPTRIADAARHFVTVRLSCGTRRREYAPDDAPAPFRALYARLSAAAGAAGLAAP